MSELSQTEYAQARGCSAAYVSKLKRQGRLVLTPNGKVNVEATDRLIENTRDPARGGDRRPGADGQGEAAHAPADAGPAAVRPVGGHETYKEAARRERIAKARLAELELAEAAGQLVRRDQVEQMVFGLARQAMDALMSLDERLAGRLAAETDEFRVAELIRTEARKIADQLAQAGTLDDVAPAPTEAAA